MSSHTCYVVTGEKKKDKKDKLKKKKKEHGDVEVIPKTVLHLYSLITGISFRSGQHHSEWSIYFPSLFTF